MNPSSTDYLPFHVPLIEEDDMRAVRDVMESRWLTTGPRSVQFEQEFARFVGARRAVAVNSGTAALHLAFEAMGLQEGDEVVVPTLTFAATAEAAIYCKARPVLVDSEPDTFNMDPAQVEMAITSRTRAIVPVHFAGHPCEMTRLFDIARRHRLVVIEDAAHALSARYEGKIVGTLGDITCFSFYATKNITTGEGGMATTNREDWADRMHLMRLHGISKDAWKRYSAEGSWKYEIVAPGFKYNLTDMQAALGISQLAKCESMWARRITLAQRYTDVLGGLDAFEVPSPRTNVQHAWHLYVLRVCPGVLRIHRDEVIEKLKERGIGTSVHFIPLHLHPYYVTRWGYQPGDFPVAEDYYDRCISLPLYPAMSDEDQTRVIDALTDIAALYGRTGSTSSFPIQTERREPPLETDDDNSVHDNTPAFQSTTRQAAATDLKTTIDPTNRRRVWNVGMEKRIFDFICALVGLTAIIPALAACAIAVWLSSPGPILFRQIRIGKNGRAFKIFKFRTMVAEPGGPQITVAGDPRVTPAGKWLRKWKLDELPQLINVLKGEMSLVGPRPELPEYVVRYTEREKHVLACKPGLTSPASLIYIDEEGTLANQDDREDYYRRVLLPHKLRVDLEYCRNASFAGDLAILLATARRLLPSKHRAPLDVAMPR